jgi:hypothetical protein
MEVAAAVVHLELLVVEVPVEAVVVAAAVGPLEVLVEVVAVEQAE